MLYQPRAWVELDASALINNIGCVTQHNNARIMAVVKADAYGHGLEFVCKTLEPYVDAFAVAALEEALALRALWPEKPITLLSGFYAAAQIEVLNKNRITPIIFNLAQIDWLEASGVQNMALGLKLDTGMGRLGIEPSQLPQAISRLQSLGARLTLVSHFASADTPESSQNQTQHSVFAQATEQHKLKRSFANSAAILTRPQDHYDLLRPGIMLYGSSPLKGVTAKSLALKPVMRFYASLVDVKHLNQGDSVGYSATWTAPKACTVGVVAVGYADGYPRVVNDLAHIAIAGKRYPLVGRVSMDSLTFRIDEAETLCIGDRVELWGETISVDEVAGWAGTIAYELLCKVTSRPERIEGKL